MFPIRFHGTTRYGGSGLLVDGLDERRECSRSRRRTTAASRDRLARQRHVVGHEHVGIADLLVHLDRLHEIDVAFVGKDLDEVVAMAANVAEMDVEDFFARAEVADDVEDFACPDFRDLPRWFPGRNSGRDRGSPEW